ncbi:MAG TPA: GNAT family N-acetyltransferase [Actinomycetes bacterium]
MSTDEASTDHPWLRRVPSAALTPSEIRAIRELLRAAFGSGEEAFTEDDWQHASGGLHFLLELDGKILAHASVVERELHLDGRPVRAGYVEAVATDPGRQGRGLGTRVMRDVTSYIKEGFELGALGTGSHHFYERLGWLRWRGPTSVRTDAGTHRTPGEDGYILILPTPSSPSLDLTVAISCEWRPGAVW